MTPEVSRPRIAVIGLGYVGLPLALELRDHFEVLGFDLKTKRIEELSAGVDRSGETHSERLKAHRNLKFTADPERLKECNVFIIAVPTPVNTARLPDLGPLLQASESVGRSMGPGSLIIYESTVYPGATEEECVPVLERFSGLSFNRDFHVGYSPERINPGDLSKGIADIVKITSGSTPEAAERVDAIYRRIIKAGTCLVSSIKVAEAAKAVENTQRDINIAFANELATIFNKMEIDTNEVLRAAGTKWNFVPVRPGLVGGHCIGVDPYYLIHKAKAVGANPRLIEAARRINDSMSDFVIDRFAQLAQRRGQDLAIMDILILGVTFKENCADVRNTRVAEIVNALAARCKSVSLHDPVADAEEVRSELGLELAPWPNDNRFDAAILAVSHSLFVSPDFSVDDVLRPGGWVLDVKGVIPKSGRVSGLSV
ncbi:MAG: nucleotide sugar dehydrogenase [Ahniella sp.]|nr:nucleotide sugar dehydrogenase [Ahniella sp.]